MSSRTIRRWGPKEPLDHRRFNEHLDATITDITVGPGLLMHRVGNSVVIGLAQRFPVVPDFHGWYTIASAAQDGSNKRWTYTAAPEGKSDVGYEGWNAKPNGSPITLFNTYEEDNGETGDMGIGVELNSEGVIEGTNLSIGPVPINGVPHRVYRVRATDEEDGTYTGEFWFSSPNPLTGTCGEE